MLLYEKKAEDKMFRESTEKENLSSARLELATFRVWGGRDNHYTTKTCCDMIVS